MQVKCLVIVMLILFATTNVHANLISNGSFELSTVTPGSSTIAVFPGETSITDWDVVFDDIHYIRSFWQASEGDRSIDLDGGTGSAGGVSQTFPTLVGETYNVIFDMAGNPADDPVIKPMRVSADGQSQDFFFDITGRSFTDMGWTTETWSFVADDSFATLDFISLTTFSGWGPALDNVIVNRSQPGNPVPEPATVALLGIGLVGIAGAEVRRRRKKKTVANS